MRFHSLPFYSRIYQIRIPIRLPILYVHPIRLAVKHQQEMCIRDRIAGVRSEAKRATDAGSRHCGRQTVPLSCRSRYPFRHQACHHLPTHGCRYQMCIRDSCNGTRIEAVGLQILPADGGNRKEIIFQPLQELSLIHIS